MICIGIDNGATGSIGIVGLKSGTSFVRTPSNLAQNYTKAKGNVSRVVFPELVKILQEAKTQASGDEIRAFMERPMINPMRFQASISAGRSMEAWMCALEFVGIGYEFIDSKSWQKVILPIGVVGAPQLKVASSEVGVRLYPQFADIIKKQKDADGLLIAEWAHRTR